ncbi:MAG: hypothetical protein QY318_04855 [Candidatus Dojkabacteria bacterium]|nr:MAG: hypothetical protein QY318_04855 [Candidatus Dojkabacteria bacterium]
MAQVENEQQQTAFKNAYSLAIEGEPMSQERSRMIQEEALKFPPNISPNAMTVGSGKPFDVITIINYQSVDQIDQKTGQGIAAQADQRQGTITYFKPEQRGVFYHELMHLVDASYGSIFSDAKFTEWSEDRWPQQNRDGLPVHMENIYSTKDYAEFFATAAESLMKNPSDRLGMFGVTGLTREEKIKKVTTIAMLEALRTTTRGFMGKDYWYQSIAGRMHWRYWLEAKQEEFAEFNVAKYVELNDSEKTPAIAFVTQNNQPINAPLQESSEYQLHSNVDHYIVTHNGTSIGIELGVNATGLRIITADEKVLDFTITTDPIAVENKLMLVQESLLSDFSGSSSSIVMPPLMITQLYPLIIAARERSHINNTNTPSTVDYQPPMSTTNKLSRRDFLRLGAVFATMLTAAALAGCSPLPTPPEPTAIGNSSTAMPDLPSPADYSLLEQKYRAYKVFDPYPRVETVPVPGVYMSETKYRPDIIKYADSIKIVDGQLVVIINGIPFTQEDTRFKSELTFVNRNDATVFHPSATSANFIIKMGAAAQTHEIINMISTSVEIVKQQYPGAEMLSVGTLSDTTVGDGLDSLQYDNTIQDTLWLYRGYTIAAPRIQEMIDDSALYFVLRTSDNQIRCVKFFQILPPRDLIDNSQLPKSLMDQARLVLGG